METTQIQHTMTIATLQIQLSYRKLSQVEQDTLTQDYQKRYLTSTVKRLLPNPNMTMTETHGNYISN